MNVILVDNSVARDNVKNSGVSVTFVYMNSEANIGRGAGYVAAAIRKAGYGITFYDSFYHPIEKIAKEVIKRKDDVLLISSMTMIFPEALRLINMIKKEFDIPVLLGGIHPTLEKEKLLKDHPEIDFLCIGEGETMVLEFLDKFQQNQLDEVPNLSYRDGDKIKSNPLAPATDLANLAPFPWDWFPDKAVVLPETGFCYVTASRGCPYSCTYCCNVIYLKTYKKSYLRTRPVADVIAELKHIKERYNPWLFYFADEMLLFDMDYVRELFKRFKEEIGGRFGLQGRVEYLDDEMVKFLADCGCRYVAMGAECGDEDFCKKVLRRKISNQMLIDAVKRIQRHDIFVSTFNMIGYPVGNDDFLTLQTIRFANQLKADYTQISVFYPFPGTVLGKKAVDEDWIDHERFNSITDYFSQSVLKDKAYVTELRDELSQLFNPKPFPNVRELQRMERYRTLRIWRKKIRYSLQNARPTMIRGLRKVPMIRTVGRAMLRMPVVRRIVSKVL